MEINTTYADRSTLVFIFIGVTAMFGSKCYGFESRKFYMGKLKSTIFPQTLPIKMQKIKNVKPFGFKPRCLIMTDNAL